MVEINGFDISLTRGDSLFLTVELTNQDGSSYTPVEGDSIRFAMKKRYKDPECLILKQIPTSMMVLGIDPEDTKNLSFGTYVYDIELTDHLGNVATPIIGTFKVTEEVH